MKILIVEDEVLSAERLKRLLNQIGQYQIQTAFNATEALLAVEKEPTFDIAFIDIKMPDISGLELAYRLSTINENIFIVFQTAYDEYAVEAFRVGAIDYILKPYTVEDVERVLKKIEKFRNTKILKFIVKNQEGKIKVLAAEDIFYVKADLKESMIRTKDEYIYYPCSISKLEERLKSEQFFRVHKSYLINLSKVDYIQTIKHSKLLFRFKEIKDIVISSKEGGKLFRERFKGFVDKQ